MKLKITLSLVGLFIFSGIFTSNAQLKNSFDVRYAETLRGNFTTIANNMMSRSSTGNYNGEDGNHDFTDNVYVDIDSDASTFNSSSANLSSFGSSSCVSIKKAYLYWTAGDKEPGSLSSDNQPNWNYNQVKVKLPGQTTYSTFTADEVLYRGRTEHFQNDPYACVKDITAQVQALGANYAGTYTVANVEAKTGTIIGHQGANGGDIIGASAGWQLVVVYEDVNKPVRNITLFDGFANVTRNAGENNYDIVFNGFRTVPNGSVNADVVLGALEGDRDLVGDRLQVLNNNGTFSDLTTALRPADNFFDSRITQYGVNYTNRNPASTNTLGFDAGVFKLDNPNNTILRNNQTSATLRLTSTQETYSLYLLGFSVEVYEPELNPYLVSTNLSNKETSLGEEFTVNLPIQNYGNDDMTDLTLKYTLPEQVDFVSANNLPTGISFTYNQSTRELIFTVADNLVQVGDGASVIAFNLKTKETCSVADTEFGLQFAGTYSGRRISYTKTDLSSSSINDSCPAKGDELPLIIKVKPSEDFTVSFDVTKVLCFGDTTGAIDLTVSGNTSPYSYSWSNGATTEDISNLAAGDYNVTVTDKFGCAKTFPVTVTENTQINADVNSTPESGLTVNDGTASVTNVTGGVGPYTYLWSTGATTAEISDLDSGDYEVTITDTNGCSVLKTVSVGTVNNLPTAVDDQVRVDEDTALNIDVVSNDDFGLDGPGSQDVVIAQSPSNGTAQVNTNGTPSDPTDDTVLYTPNPGFSGTDTFTYTITDGNGDPSTATVTVTVSNVIVVPPGERGCDCAPLYGQTNFISPTLVSGSNLQVGAVYRFSNVFLDAPAGSQVDALVKIVAFNNGASLLNIDVNDGRGVREFFQPYINSTNNGDQSVEFEITFVSSGGSYGDEVEISFFATPYDIDGDSVATREYAEVSLSDAYYQSQNTEIRIERKMNSVRGTAVSPATAPGGDISTDPRYTFSNYFEGRSTLKYIAGKENGNFDRYYSLALESANYQNPQSTIVTAPVICGNVSDEGGDPLRGVSVSLSGSDGSSASTTTDINGNYRFATAIPSALVNVTYTITETDLDGYVSVSDVEGDPADNKITRVINLISSCGNDFVDDGRPVAQDDAAIASPLRPVQPVDIDVLANDTFGPDGPSSGTISIVSQPAVGEAVVNDGGTPNDPTDDFITYNPPLVNLQPTSFVYKICDSDGDCDEATVLINISNDVPEAEDDTFTVSEDSENNVLNVLANDFFGNDGAGFLSIVNTTPNGDLSVNDNGTPGDASDDFLVYTPNENFFGTDTFTYQICDANNDCVTATGTIIVEADPVLSVENVEVVEGQPLVFMFTLAEVSDEDVIISVSTSDGTAAAGLDYDAVINQIITIPAGELTAEYTVNSLEDNIFELSENFTITGTVQTNNTRNLVAEATGTILDNEDP
ncbi:Ig-like domain-containing protein, partial [Leeuwenhoekiella nanhaiensis]